MMKLEAAWKIRQWDSLQEELIWSDRLSRVSIPRVKMAFLGSLNGTQNTVSSSQFSL